MSFSKAKLKRFNEVPVGDSPSCSTTDRKDQIKKFLKDLKDSTTGNHKDKEPKIPTTPVTSDTESVKSSKSATMRLFRTPSLPHRLRFRQNSDTTTPKKELKKDVLRGKEALQAAQVEIKNKTEMLQEYTTQIDELRTQVYQLKETETKTKLEYTKIIDIKDKEIENLSNELKTIEEIYKNLKCKENELTEKIESQNNEIKLLLESHEGEITFLTGINTELELNKEKLVQDQHKINNENYNLKQEIELLTDEINIINLSIQTNDNKYQESNLAIEKLSTENICLLDDIKKLKKQMQDDMLNYVADSQKMLKELDQLKYDKIKLSNELMKKSELINALQEELSEKVIDLDLDRDTIRESFQDEINILTKKYEQQINTLKEINDMKIKEIESIHCLDMAKLNRDYQDEKINLNKYKNDVIQQTNESAEEKIRISEIQNEQKIKELEKNLEDAINRERKYWKNEIDKCQKIAETEIIQGELEKQDLKTLLENAHEMLREREVKIQNFEGQLTNGIDYYVRLSEQLEQQINDVKQECGRIMTEKYNYQLTLNNTRSTVNILMERLKKSDSDVEILKIDLEAIQNSKNELELQNKNLEHELKHLKSELDEYKNALQSLRNSSMALEREMKEKETIFEKLMTSEEETLETVNKIGKLFNERIEENIDKYFEMYVELKCKYEARETYIKDMKSLLDDFATNIELARLELVTKDNKLMLINNENKNIKLENMTLKYRCEQFEKYQNDNQQNIIKKFDEAERDDIVDKQIIINVNDNNDNDDGDDLISNQIIENVLAELDSDLNNINCDKLKTLELNSKIVDENKKLKDTLSEQIRRNNLLQEMIESENSIDACSLQKMIDEKDKALQDAQNIARETTEKYNELKNQANLKNLENLKETNAHLKNKILQLQNVTKEQELKITELQDKAYNGTPRKTIIGTVHGTPRTPKTPKTPKSLFFPGKENLSPAIIETIKSPKNNILKPRN